VNGGAGRVREGGKTYVSEQAQDEGMAGQENGGGVKGKTQAGEQKSGNRGGDEKGRGLDLIGQGSKEE